MKQVKLKSDDPEYTSLKQVERDIMLMFANCVMFNHEDDDLVKLTRSMRDDVLSSFDIFEEAET